MLPVLSALVLGFLGSLHCIGMCGPIVLVLPGGGETRGWGFAAGRVLYNLGRSLTYAAFGFVIGLIGQSVALAGYQQALGIVAGALMVLSVAVPGRWWKKLLPRVSSGRVTGAVQARLGGMLRNGSASSLFAIGILNGFLPCGLVYTALAASIGFGSAIESALFMFLFGVGTSPALVALSYAAGMITHTVRRRITRWLPLGVALMGVFFILRGLSLGIPFLSPDMEKVKSKMTSSSHMHQAADTSGAAMEALRDSVPPCCQH